MVSGTFFAPANLEAIVEVDSIVGEVEWVERWEVQALLAPYGCPGSVLISREYLARLGSLLARASQQSDTVLHLFALV
jgi:hypothetical protein